MDLLLVLSLAAVAVALIAWKLYGNRPAPGRDPLDFGSERRPARPGAGYQEPQTRFVEPVTRKPYQLLNSAEQALYQQLREAMPNMIIFAQVGMAQLAQLRGRQAVEEMLPMLGRGVDFVVCREDFAILAAIELMWPSQAGDGRPSPEAAKRAALERLGIPLIVFQPNQVPDPDAIGRAIAEAIVRRNLLEAERERRARGPLSAPAAQMS